MSTKTVSFRTTAEDIDLARLRHEEEMARQAAREAAQRAHEQRQQEETARRRTAEAHRKIASADAHFRALVTRLDEAASRLPDLALVAPKLVTLSSDIVGNLVALEGHADEITAQVRGFEMRLNQGIAQAESRQRRRIAKAAAWRESSDLKGQIDLRRQSNRDIANLLGEAPDTTSLPVPPATDAKLEAVESYVARLRAALAAANSANAALKARQATRQRAASLAGSTQVTPAAGESLQRFDTAVQAAARKRLQDRITAALKASGQTLSDLSGTVRLLIEDAETNAGTQDQGDRVARLIAREKALSDGVTMALSLIRQPPDLSQGDPDLSQRWTNLLIHLERVANGQDAFSPTMEREYSQIEADARRQRNAAFSKASWIHAMAKQGFEVLERDDGPGLILVDLANPDVWLEATEVMQGGQTEGFGATLEMKTDAMSGTSHPAAAPEKVTADICSRLAKASEAGSHTVAVTEVVERKGRIARAARPAKARRALARSA